MAGVQQDNKIFPHVVPGPPASEDEFMQWSQSMSVAVQELTRQVVDKFNLHVDQQNAHYKSWRASKVRKPSFKTNPSDATQILIEASATSPAYFVVGERLFQSVSNITLDMDSSGPGGLRTGLTKTADTVYYIYAINDNGDIALIADTVAPSTGLTGYSDWSYVGAFVTVASGNLDQIQCTNGMYLQDNSNANHEVTSSNTSLTSKTLSKIPSTAKWVYGRLNFSAINAAGDSITIGSSSSSGISRLRTGTATVGQSPIGFVWIPLTTANTIYMLVTNAADTGVFRTLGWIEDPSEYK